MPLGNAFLPFVFAHSMLFNNTKKGIMVDLKEDIPFWKKSFIVEVIRIMDIFDKGAEFSLDLITSEENRGLGRAVDIVC